MKVELKNISGNGSIDGPSLISYQYSEDVTSLEPSTINGGTGQVTVSALSVSGDKVGNTHPDSKLLINNQMALVHQDSGEVRFTVKQISKNVDAVSLVGDTIQSRLNKNVTARPQGGTGATLLTALRYYCGLAGISSANSNLVFEGTLATDLGAISANFVGWNGNLWDHLKMFCAAVSVGANFDIGIEAYIDVNKLVFRRARTTNANFDSKNLSSQSININGSATAQQVDIFNYDTSYKTNSVVQALNVNKENLQSNALGVTTDDSIQVNPGQTVTVRFEINASLVSVNQPAAVDQISPLPYTSGDGQYVVAGNDGILLKASQWRGEGGKLTVKLTENPNEIEVTVVGPRSASLTHAADSELGFAPYRIGIEVADGEEYPSMYITGTGVFYNKTSHTIYTGAPASDEVELSAPAIDNPFITNLRTLYNKGAAAAQAICGPIITLSESVATAESFGQTPGKLRTVESNKFRINTVSYSPEGTTTTASPSATFADFNALWTKPDTVAYKFQDFTNTALNPTTYPNEAMKFNEFTVIPLMKPEPLV
jgi:hypothetical protein